MYRSGRVLFPLHLRGLVHQELPEQRRVRPGWRMRDRRWRLRHLLSNVPEHELLRGKMVRHDLSGCDGHDWSAVQRLRWFLDLAAETLSLTPLGRVTARFSETRPVPTPRPSRLRPKPSPCSRARAAK